MDPIRFDRLVRSLAHSSSRRAALLGLLSGLAAPLVPDAAARGNGKRKRHGDGDDDDQQRNSVGAEAQDKGRKRRKRKGKKKRGKDTDGGGQTPPPAACCGTKQCAPPEPGGARSDCDYAGESFLGQDLHGSTFRGIDGRNAIFTATDNHGSVFAEACLQGARFRRAKLEGSTWGGACLFDADFTGAELDDDDPLFAEGLFCNTTMPDGSINNRDCGRATACCRAELGGGDPCQSAVDCADLPCQAKACQNGVCVYDEVFTGPSPNSLCTFCCENGCCLEPANQCNTANACCAPNCAGRECGPDGCGSGGACGRCADGQTCNGNGRCVCTRQSCRDGCCDGDTCRPGTANQVCGTGGAACESCGTGQACLDQACAPCTPRCNDGQGDACGPDGCGGSCGSCGAREGYACDETSGRCACTAGLCEGCCFPGPGQPGSLCLVNDASFCTRGGAACVECTGDECCAPDTSTCQPLSNPACVCDAATCPSGCCSNGPGNGGFCFAGTRPSQCGAGGVACADCTDLPTIFQCCGQRCARVDGSDCGSDGDCCTGNCFGGSCADRAARCGATACDPPAKGCCGDTCCAAGDTTCCGATCCGREGSTCCGDACCFPGQACCGGACCAAGTVCCGSACCAAGFSCCGGVCCSPGLCCGPVDGEFCCLPPPPNNIVCNVASGEKCFFQPGGAEP